MQPDGVFNKKRLALPAQVMPLIPCLILAGVSYCAGAQAAVAEPRSRIPEPQQQAPAIHLEVKQVLVPVVVTDSKGHSILGLRSKDFKVFEDGIPQRIVGFSTEGDGADKLFQPQPLTGVQSVKGLLPSSPQNERGQGRTFLIAIDTLNSRFENFARIRSALKGIFGREQADEARYALVLLSRTLSVAQALTRDPMAVFRALENKRTSRSIISSEKSNLTLQESQLVLMLQKLCEQCPCRMSQGMFCQDELRKAESFAGFAAEEQSAAINDFLRSLRMLVNQFGAIPGKRTLLLLSDGFSPRPGQGLFDLIAAYTGLPQPAQDDPVAPLESQMQEILRAAEDRNVTFYTIDSRGLYVNPPGGYDVTNSYHPTSTTVPAMPEVERRKRIEAVEETDGLQELAASTGGLFFGNSNDLKKGIRRALADGRAYYVLVYNPSDKTEDGKFRKIRVEVDREKLLVRAKRGYWAPSGSGSFELQ